MRNKRFVTAALGLLLSALVTLVALPVAPANAAYVYKYGKCGAFKSGLRGFMSLTYSYAYKEEFKHVKATVSNRKSQISTYGCTDGKKKTISKVRLKTIIRVGGLSFSGCTVSTSGANCSAGASEAKYDSGWKTSPDKSQLTHTVTKFTATAIVRIHSVTNRVDGNWVAGTQDYDDYFDHYCDGKNGRSSCSKRNG
ncbi:hypothetical protein [Nonomuraea jabiensis]|uniref:hypothetical protein n=1 Tax=Nonomuraea jabiensis TaxID=882448 RepID=UPI003D71179F